jgi:uncharacterized protein YuzE
MEAKLTTRSLYYNADTDTLDIWLEDPSAEASGEPLTENLVSKLNSHGGVIGYEIIQLSRVNNEDMKKLPREVRSLLKESAKRFSVLRD